MSILPVMYLLHWEYAHYGNVPILMTKFQSLSVTPIGFHVEFQSGNMDATYAALYDATQRSTFETSLNFV
ncbi:hypothetical protein GCM10025859_20790 [Alicyclobacillus fastidiosus]|nr:hypothetical protein GCM10025859_20790 [Alicyclobacillus fastidiosus]